jgi:5-methylcytosine-specific restriction endonuclease McrA
MADENYRRLNCGGCGSAFANTHKAAMYCAKACKLKAWIARNPDRHKAHREKEAAKPETVCRVFAGYCVGCGGAFVARNLHQRYCTKTCVTATAKAAYQANSAVRKAMRSMQGCAVCGGSVGGGETKPRRYCSDTCARASETTLSSRRAGKSRRRARLKNVLVESVDPFKVFDRDGWRCQLCGTKTPKTKRGTYADNAPELDHILPLSKGGEHSYLNTQCTCRRCNATKSDTPMGQMLLVG